MPTRLCFTWALREGIWAEYAGGYRKYLSRESAAYLLLPDNAITEAMKHAGAWIDVLHAHF